MKNCQILVSIGSPARLVPSCVCAMDTDSPGLCTVPEMRGWLGGCCPELCPWRVGVIGGQSSIVRAMRLAEEINAIWNGQGSAISGDAHTEMHSKLQDIKILLGVDSAAALEFVWI